MNTKRCVIYSRVASTVISNPREGIDYQNMECKKFAQSKGYIVSNIFEDIALSGTTGILNRLDEIITYCNANAVKTIIVKDFTRLSRNTFNMLLILERLGKHNIVVRSINEGDLKHENTNLTMQILTSQAYFQNKVHSEKIKAGLARKKLTTKHI